MFTSVVVGAVLFYATTLLVWRWFYTRRLDPILPERTSMILDERLSDFKLIPVSRSGLRCWKLDEPLEIDVSYRVQRSRTRSGAQPEGLFSVRVSSTSGLYAPAMRQRVSTPWFEKVWLTFSLPRIPSDERSPAASSASIWELPRFLDIEVHQDEQCLARVRFELRASMFLGDLCRSPDLHTPTSQHVLLLGPKASGKSTFINTSMVAMSDRDVSTRQEVCSSRKSTLFLKPYPMKILRPECPLVLWDMWGLHVDKRHNMACPTRLLKIILLGQHPLGLSVSNGLSLINSKTVVELRAQAAAGKSFPKRAMLLIWPADQLGSSEDLLTKPHLADLVKTCYRRWTDGEALCSGFRPACQSSPCSGSYLS
jgi:hypothetical protein